MRHHFDYHSGQPNMQFGITTPFWDVVFGTYVDHDTAANNVTPDDPKAE